MLHHLTQAIQEEDNVLSDWRDGIDVKVPNKGDLRESKTCTAGNTREAAQQENLQEVVEWLRENKAGFRNGRSR